ncbi:MAG: TolC family protein [Candidatus Hydrogenedentes bacterium]|nr:TolC family protein [Candidatus Hydrogenedentota bacterium]
MKRVLIALSLIVSQTVYAADAPGDAPASGVTPEPATAPMEDAASIPGIKLLAPLEPDAADGATILDLPLAEQIAIADNPSLKAAVARVQQAKARVRQAVAAWYPQLDLLASATNTWLSERDYLNARRAASDGLWSQWALGTQARLQGQIVSNFSQVLNGVTSLVLPNTGTGQAGQQGFGASSPALTNAQIFQDLLDTSLLSIKSRGSVDDSFENYNISLIASWVMFNGFERKFAIAEAKYGSQEFEAAYQEAQRLLLSAVAQTYHSAQLARENIGIAEADQAFNERQLKEAKARRRVGTGSLSDELNFEVRVNAARASLIQAYQDYNIAIIALSELLGFADARFPENYVLAPLNPESLEELNPPEPEALVQLAKSSRPDLAGSELAVKRTAATIGRARAPFYPTVTAQASKDGFRSDNFKFGEKDFGTSVGVNVQYNLYAGGAKSARVTEAKALRTEAEHSLHETELAVASEVRQAVQQLQAAQEQLVLQRANAVFVQRNRDLVEKEYAGGVGSLVRLNEAQRDLVSAEGNLAAARVQLRQAWHDVYTATGETVVPYTTDSGMETTVVEAGEEE